MKTKRLLMLLLVALALIFSGCGSSGDDSEDNNGSGGGSAGSTKEEAVLVIVGNSSTHEINRNGVHWFKFEGTGDHVIFETKGNVVDTKIFLHKEGSLVASGSSDGDRGEGSNDLIGVNTTLGTMYWIEVATRSGTSGIYTFVVTASTANIRTNSIPTTTGYSSQHTISQYAQHWFSFQGTGNSVIFETESNVVNTYINLFIGDAAGAILSDKNRISFSTLSGTTYYIKITGSDGTYTFSVKNGTGDGSSKSNAIPVIVGNSSTHEINRNGVHWFSFLGTGEKVSFKTKGNVVDTNIFVHKEGSLVASDGVGVNTTLGTMYWIEVAAQSGTSGTYTFVVE